MYVSTYEQASLFSRLLLFFSSRLLVQVFVRRTNRCLSVTTFSFTYHYPFLSLSWLVRVDQWGGCEKQMGLGLN